MMKQSCSGGSFTRMGWNRRSRAASFSKYWRYSLTVVAPMHWSSPRARAGLRMLAASSESSLETKVWISSMNKMISPAAFLTSSRSFLRRSSYSPRREAPARIEKILSSKMRLFWRSAGTCLAAII